MFYCTTDGQYIQEGTQFVIDGITYPPQWLNQSTPEQKTELGLEEVVATNSPYNPVYYWTGEVLEEATLTYTGTAKDLVDIQKQAVAQVNQTAYALLLPTDYVEARNLRNPDYKLDWMLWRDSIRATAKTYINAINATTDVDGVASIMSSIVWPNDPNTITV